MAGPEVKVTVKQRSKFSEKTFKAGFVPVTDEDWEFAMNECIDQAQSYLDEFYFVVDADTDPPETHTPE